MSVERMVFILLMIALTGVAEAAGFRNPPEGAPALGRIGGRIVFADDASAVSHNPANLVKLESSSAMAGATAVRAEVDYRSSEGMSAGTIDPWKWLPYVFVAAPMSDGDFAAGLGFSVPFGQSTEWPRSDLFRYTAPYMAELRALDLNPVVAARVGDRLTLALGGNVYFSDLDIRQVFPWSMLAPQMPDGEIRFDGDGYGYGGNIAVSWQIGERHSIAATYRSAVKVEYDGDTRLIGAPAGMPGRSDFSSEIEFPAVAAVGYGIRLSDAFRVEANVEWIEFSRYDELPLNAGAHSMLLPRAGVPQQWKDSWTYGVGAEWRVAQCVALRLGYIFIESPVPDTTMAPTLPDADRHVASFGIGFNRGSHTLDLAVAHSFFGTRTIRNNVEPAYNGEYELESNIFGLSYSRAF